MSMNGQVNINDLRARFLGALSEAGVQHSGAALFEELLARYGESHRRYHTIAHVDACLDLLDWYRGSALRPARVSLALWFHDAIYDPCANDNEGRSAQLAVSRLGELAAPRAVVTEIEAHVLATRGHRGHTPDARLVVDLDLAILGADRRAFAQFERGIREEYGHVSEPGFVAGRLAVLSGFLARSEIYATQAMRDEREVRARQNLQRRIAELSTHILDLPPEQRELGPRSLEWGSHV